MLTQRVFLSSVVGRLPMGALGLIFILRTREMTGSYAAGGLVAGAHALAHGIGAPMIGRLVDRRGQTAVLVCTSIVFAIAMTAFALLPDGSGLELAALCAAVAGAGYPPLSACLRALWTKTLRTPDERHSAYAIESAVFELVYIAGPLLLITAVGAWSLRAAAAATAVFVVVGGFAFAGARDSRRWLPDTERERDLAGALRGPGVRLILGALLLIGISVAAIEIAVAAFAEDAGSKAAVGPLLALWGVGSLIGGVVASRRRAPADPPRRLAVLLAGLAATSLPLALAPDVWTLGVLMVVAGLFIAPSLALAFSLLGEIAPAGTVTEAYTWVGTGFGGGIATGSALGGWIVESSSIAGSFALAGVAVIAAAALISARRPALRVPVAATA